jgi:hypothetical protein
VLPLLLRFGNLLQQPQGLRPQQRHVEVEPAIPGVQPWIQRLQGVLRPTAAQQYARSV